MNGPLNLDLVIRVVNLLNSSRGSDTGGCGHRDEEPQLHHQGIEAVQNKSQTWGQLYCQGQVEGKVGAFKSNYTKQNQDKNTI